MKQIAMMRAHNIDQGLKYHEHHRKIFLLAINLLLYSKPSVGCQDNDEKIAKFAAIRGYEGVTGCSDVSRACALQSGVGDKLREVCCQTCKDYGNVENIYPPDDGGG